MAFVCRKVREDDLDRLYASPEADIVVKYLGKREYCYAVERGDYLSADDERRIYLLQLPVHRDDPCFGNRHLFAMDGKVVIFQEGFWASLTVLPSFTVLYLSPVWIPAFDSIEPFIREAVGKSDSYFFFGYEELVRKAEFVHPELDRRQPFDPAKAEALNRIFDLALGPQKWPRRAGYWDIRHAESSFDDFMLGTIRGVMAEDSRGRFARAADLRVGERRLLARLKDLDDRIEAAAPRRTPARQIFDVQASSAWANKDAHLLRQCARNIPPEMEQRRRLRRTLLDMAVFADQESRGQERDPHARSFGLVFLTLALRRDMNAESSRREKMKKERDELTRELDRRAREYVEWQFFDLWRHPDTRRARAIIGGEPPPAPRDGQALLPGKWHISDQVQIFDGHCLDTSEDKGSSLLGEEIEGRKERYPYRFLESDDRCLAIELILAEGVQRLLPRGAKGENRRRYFLYFSADCREMRLVGPKRTSSLIRSSPSPNTVKLR